MVPKDNGRPPPMWGATFLSNKVLLARNELLTLLRTKLQMEQTWTNIVRLAKTVDLKCFGVAVLLSDKVRRKVVGTSRVSPARRDFVRLKGSVENSALSVQVICFVRVSGLRSANIPVPDELLDPLTNACDSDKNYFHSRPMVVTRSPLPFTGFKIPSCVSPAFWIKSRVVDFHSIEVSTGIPHGPHVC